MAGTEVYRDFVELPSQIMENWADKKEWIDTFARHYQTGEKIPLGIYETAGVGFFVKQRSAKFNRLNQRVAECI